MSSVTLMLHSRGRDKEQLQGLHYVQEGIQNWLDVVEKDDGTAAICQVTEAKKGNFVDLLF